MSNDVGQVNLLNAQFQSVFSTGAALDLITPCHTTMLNGANSLVKGDGNPGDNYILYERS